MIPPLPPLTCDGSRPGNRLARPLAALSWDLPGCSKQSPGPSPASCWEPRVPQRGCRNRAPMGR